MSALFLVVAVAANGVIGAGGTLPWHLPADLKRFKALTRESFREEHPAEAGRPAYAFVTLLRDLHAVAR